MEIKTVVRNTVAKIISETMDIDMDKVAVRDDESLIESGLIDSVSIVPLIEYFGAEFEIEIEPEELTLEYWDSIKAITAFIEMKTSE